MSTNTNPNLFLEAVRNKLRFDTTSGQLNTEDIWDLSLASLDSLAVKVSTKLKDATETFLKSTDPKKDAERSLNELRLEILKVVIETKQTEAEKLKNAAAKRTQRKFLKDLLEQKKLDNLGAMTEAEIQKQLDELELDRG